MNRSLLHKALLLQFLFGQVHHLLIETLLYLLFLLLPLEGLLLLHSLSSVSAPNSTKESAFLHIHVGYFFIELLACVQLNQLLFKLYLLGSS